jgi:hypothetical protein
MKKIKTTLIVLFLGYSINLLNAQVIKTHANGTVHIGNTSVAPLDNNTRFEVNVQKAIIRGVAPVLPGSTVGFQFLPGEETTYVLIGNRMLTETTSVMRLMGLNNNKAIIGRSSNTIYKIYSNEYFGNSEHVGILTGSDADLKTNIRELSQISDRILKLRPVTYDFLKTSSGEDVSENPAYKNRTGFIAQEVKELFPDLVVIDYESGLHCLDYAGLIPYLTKVIQEQNKRIEKLEQQIGIYDDGGSTVNKMPQINENGNVQSNTSILFQNAPNPFNVSTTIKYQLAGNTVNAKICIYNLTGKQLQCYNLPSIKGESAIEVRASSLQSGMYLYSLIVDDELIATKRMILTE